MQIMDCILGRSVLVYITRLIGAMLDDGNSEFAKGIDI